MKLIIQFFLEGESPTLRKGVLKHMQQITGEHPCQSAILTKLLCNFIETALQYVCSPLKLLHIFQNTIS